MYVVRIHELSFVQSQPHHAAQQKPGKAVFHHLKMSFLKRSLRALLVKITGWQVLCVVLGIVLLAAVLFKVHELSITLYLDNFPPRWVMIVFTELEILFALRLFFVPKKLLKFTRLVTLESFSFFTRVTLCKALTGEAFFDCSGRIEINP